MFHSWIELQKTVLKQTNINLPWRAIKQLYMQKYIAGSNAVYWVFRILNVQSTISDRLRVQKKLNESASSGHTYNTLSSFKNIWKYIRI